MKTWRNCLAILTLLGATAPAVAADNVILTIDQESVQHHFTLQQLAALPQTTITTATPWTTGQHRYQGVAIDTLLQRLNLSPQVLKVHALNDFWARVPTTVARQYRAILATHVDGQPMSRRNKGPLWVIFPLSEHPELNQEKYHNYMVWQVRTIKAE